MKKPSPPPELEYVYDLVRRLRTKDTKVFQNVLFETSIELCLLTGIKNAAMDFYFAKDAKKRSKAEKKLRRITRKYVMAHAELA